MATVSDFSSLLTTPPRVSLYLRVGDNHYSPAYAANGKLRPLVAVIQGVERRFEDGVYRLRYQVDGKRRWKAVGNDPQLALVRKIQLERTLAAEAAGFTVKAHESELWGSGPLTSLRGLVVEYLKETKDHKKRRTYLSYRRTLRGFLAATPQASSLTDIRRHDIMNWIAVMRQHGFEPRTVFNRTINLKTFILHFKAPWPLAKKDMPRFTPKPPRPYSNSELERLIEYATEDDVDLISFLVESGGRNGEIAYSTWADIVWERKVFRIAVKNDAELTFEPKDREEGDVPLTDAMIERLLRRRLRYPNCRLIFPAPAGGPDTHLLRRVKELGLRAGINCGDCVNKRGKSCKTHSVCKRVIVHRFRKNFATIHVQNGTDIKTTQAMLRHSDLGTTLGYIASASVETAEMRTRVNSAFAFLSKPRTSN